ncbi:hypothetical protein [Sunxiuqinia rutila]
MQRGDQFGLKICTSDLIVYFCRPELKIENLFPYRWIAINRKE